jgi:hypothetical protein
MDGKEKNSIASGLEKLSFRRCYRNACKGSCFGVREHSFVELRPEKKRTGAVHEEADCDSQVTLAPSRNPGLQRVLPEWTC